MNSLLQTTLTTKDANGETLGIAATLVAIIVAAFTLAAFSGTPAQPQIRAEGGQTVAASTQTQSYAD